MDRYTTTCHSLDDRLAFNTKHSESHPFSFHQTIKKHTFTKLTTTRRWNASCVRETAWSIGTNTVLLSLAKSTNKSCQLSAWMCSGGPSPYGSSMRFGIGFAMGAAVSDITGEPKSIARVNRHNFVRMNIFHQTTRGTAKFGNNQK